MILTGLMSARNEAWIVGLSLRAALRWCDSAVVLLHACTDGTESIVEQVAQEHAGRVHILTEPDPNWAEMSHRQKMLEAARERGATHIAYVDADEVLCGHLVEPIRQHIERLPAAGYIRLSMFCMWRSLTEYRDDTSVFGKPCTSMLAFRDDPRIQWDARTGYDHHRREPYGSRRKPRTIRTPYTRCYSRRRR